MYFLSLLRVRLCLGRISAKEGVEPPNGNELVIVVFAGWVDALCAQQVVLFALFGRNAEENYTFRRMFFTVNLTKQIEFESSLIHV